VAGKHLKAKTGWNSFDPPGSGSAYSCEDTYGFSALPGGYGSGDFKDVGSFGSWWSSSENGFGSNNADRCYMNYNGNEVGWDYVHKSSLFSVRCVQD